jgi:hypothetical protein
MAVASKELERAGRGSGRTEPSSKPFISSGQEALTVRREMHLSI